MATAKLLSFATYSVPRRLKVTELFFDVPFDHSAANSKKIRLFGRSVEKAENPAAPSEEKPKQLPWMVYLQGGPGFGCSQPQDYGFTKVLLDRGYKLLFLDQRGMGLSSPITARTLALEGDVSKQVDYLKHFRADTAVKDLEAVRRCLTADYPDHTKKWSLVGQSYGGFVATTYLSFAPEGLREVFTLGGMPPVSQKSPHEVYRRLYKKLRQRNNSYYERFAEDAARVESICQYLQQAASNAPVTLPNGELLLVGRFLQMGMQFGREGGFAAVHSIITRAYHDLQNLGFLTKPTLAVIQATSSFEEHVLYAIMHESIYCQNGATSNWSAEQELPDDFTVPRFRGEMVYRTDLEIYPELIELASVAEELALVEWPDLYDVEQLRRNEVPVYAATYLDDMYVDSDFARETAATIKGAKTFVTNAMYHDAIRSRMDEVFKALFALRDDIID